MKGRIKTYLSIKGYGFIKGDDGKNYFFHVDEFKDSNKLKYICEEAYVEFEQVATPKGYKAVQCILLNENEVDTYVTPNTFMTSKTLNVKGWEVLEKGDWMVVGSSSNSPDEAKKNTINYAKMVGANALLEMDYFKTTGEVNNRSIFDSPNYKGGKYRYTIHNFRARTGIVAKKNVLGNKLKDDLIGTNRKAQLLKGRFDELNNKNKNKILIGTIVFFICVGIAYLSGIHEIGFAGIFGLLTWYFQVDYGGWLRKI